MADQKITQLTADTGPTTDDLVVTVNDPAGTPGNKKVTIANLLGIASSIISTALVENFFRARHQAITTNTQPTGLTVQHGWTFVLGSGGTGVISKTVTFPVAFSAAPPCVIITSLGGKDTSDPTAISDFSLSVAEVGWATNIGTTTFDIKFQDREAAGTTSATRRYGWSWIAIGTV